MANEKANAYIEQIRLIMDKQLDLVYEYHEGKDVDGCADDFPFFNLFVHLKMELYKALLTDLYKQGCDMSAYLHELNELPEFKEMGVSIGLNSDGLVFPDISTFASRKENRNYTYYKFELFPYNRYILGLEYIIFKFAPIVIEKLYSDWIANEEDVYKSFTFNVEYFGIQLSEEDMVNDQGKKTDFIQFVSQEIKWKRFVEQVDYYNYCQYRKSLSYEGNNGLDSYCEEGNLWEINTDKTFGVRLVKDMDTETEDVVELIVSVPYLNEAFVRAFHDVKSGGCYVWGEQHFEGTPGLHLTSKCKEKIKAKRTEYLNKGYDDVTEHPDFDNMTEDGVEFFDLDAIDRNKKYWDAEGAPDFLDKGHYLFLLRQDSEESPDGSDVTEKDEKDKGVDLPGKQKLLKGYKTFLLTILNAVFSEQKKGVFKTPSLIEDVLRKTYRGMHKLYVSQALTIKTARADSRISKEELKQQMEVPNKKNVWYDIVDYYRKGEFTEAQLRQASELLGYELLERIE